MPCSLHFHPSDMMNKSMLIGATGLLLLVGAGVISRQSGASAVGIGISDTNGGKSAEAHRLGSHSSTVSGDRRAAKAASVANLLERLEACQDDGDGFDRETFSALLEKLLQLDGGMAASFVDSIPAGHVRSEALRRFAQSLASRDPERAGLWATSLADEAERGSALVEVCSRIALKDAGEAVRTFERHQLDGHSGGLLENLVQQWADQDYSAAAAWTLARPIGEQRDQMCGRLAIVLSATEPANAANLVLKEIPEGLVQTEAAVSVLYQWGARDMEGASEWVALFPPGSLKERAENELQQLRRLR